MTHKDCIHPKTKSARAGCRLLTQMIDRARELGLSVKIEHTNGWITSVIIKDESDFGSSLICTLGMTLRIVRVPFGCPSEPVKLKSALIWVDVIGHNI